MTDDAEKFLNEFFSASSFIIARTSGSTGKPKTIELSKADMRASASSTNDFFAIDSQSTLFSPLSCDYIAGKMMVVRAIESNARLILEAPSNMPLRSVPNGSKIDLVPIVPSQIDGLIESSSRIKLKNVIVGGAPLDSAQENRLMAMDANVYATYGMTETCSHVALRSISENETLFTALPGVKFACDDESRLIIYRKGADVEEWHTNDIVELRDSVSFRWIGRYDNIINSGGLKINPEEVEKDIAHLMGHQDFYVTSRRSEKWGAEAILVMSDIYRTRRNASDLLEKMKEILGPKTPKDIMYVSEIARTPNGKIKRQKIE